MVDMGMDIWIYGSNPTLLQFKDDFLFQFDTLPTNIQLAERDVKESGCVTLGKMWCELPQSVVLHISSKRW